VLYWFAAMKRWWKKIRHGIEWLALGALTTLIPCLPRRGVVWLADGLGWLAYYCDGRGRTVALANLAIAFGDRYGPADQARIARKSYRNFSRTMCDLFWSPRLTSENYRRYLLVENREILQELRSRGESAVFVCVHHGNFEWASLAVGFEVLQERTGEPDFQTLSRSVRASHHSPGKIDAAIVAAGVQRRGRGHAGRFEFAPE
jgi:lauroyl/myristoyl acyltransferase